LTKITKENLVTNEKIITEQVAEPDRENYVVLRKKAIGDSKVLWPAG